MPDRAEALADHVELLQARVEALEERLAIVRTEALEEAAGLCEGTATERLAEYREHCARPNAAPTAAAVSYGEQAVAGLLADRIRALITEQAAPAATEAKETPK